MSDREEKLRAAKEKLNKFRKKKSNRDTPSPNPSSSSLQLGENAGLSSYFGMDQAASTSDDAFPIDSKASDAFNVGSNTPDAFSTSSSSVDIFANIPTVNNQMLAPTNHQNQNIFSSNPSYNEPAAAMVKVGLNDVFVTYDDNEGEGVEGGVVMGSVGGYNKSKVGESSSNDIAESAGIGGNFSATAPPMPPYLGDSSGGVLLPESVQNFHPQPEIENFQSTIKGYKEEISNLELLLQKERSEKEFALRDLETEQVGRATLIQELERIRYTTGSALQTNRDPSEWTNLNHQLATLQADIVTKNNTLELVVAEKSELESKGHYLGEQCRIMLQEKQGLTQEIDSLRQIVNDYASKAELNATSDVAVGESERKAQDLQFQVQDLTSEKIELELKLKRVCEEQTKEKQQIKLLSSELEMTKVHLTQLRGVGADTSQSQQITSLTEQLKEARMSLNSVAASRDKMALERNRLAEQYRSYSKDLAHQAERLSEQVRRYQDENAKLIHRESGLVGQIEQMEKQLQKYVQGGKNITEEENSTLKERCINLETENRQAKEAASKLEQMYTDRSEQVEDVMKRLALKESKLNELNTVISELHNSNEMLKSQAGESKIQPEILAAMESDKVAASRAMQQNNTLKQQIEELQKELVNLINSKAVAIDELEDAKRRVEKLAGADSQIKALEEAVSEREGTIGGLRNQIRYLESQNRDEGEAKDDTLPSTELLEAFNTIRSLNSINSELRSQLEVLSSQTREGSESRTNSSTPGNSNRGTDLNIDPSSGQPTHSATSSSCDMEQSSSSASSSSESFVEVCHGDQDIASPDPNHNYDESEVDKAVEVKETSEDSTENSSTLPLTTPIKNNQKFTGLQANLVSPNINLETWKKLEDRFISAMNHVADLSSDKEQLEHLVTRLQDETDTITDYIIMYQHQRKQQKLRLQEKEDQLQQLARDKTNLQTKLEDLHNLVEQLLSHQNQGVPEGQQIESESTAITADALSATADADTAQADNVSASADKSDVTADTVKTTKSISTAAKKDAKKIYELLSEIQAESKQMVNNVENFQPFFFDNSNGKVITV